MHWLSGQLQTIIAYHRIANSMTVQLHQATERIRSAFKNYRVEDTTHKTFRKVYVPQIRCLRQLQHGEDSISAITRNEYGIDAGIQATTAARVTTHIKIETGQSMYDTLQRKLLGTYADRKWVAEYERYLSRSFFMGENITLIPRISGPGGDTKRTLHIKIGNEQEHPIYNLGDGLQQLIMLTNPYMLNPEDRVLLFVEEPELYLHPGFQRALIDAWTSYDGSLQVFLTTHSSEFLDITLDSNDISVFRCSKSLPGGTEDQRLAEVTITALSTGDRPILKELGIRNSSLMLSNCTIWVEGITDRMYLRRYLELYMEHLAKPPTATPAKRFLEDVHYSFVEYGGANITHWSFLEDGSGEKKIDVDRLCGELLLVMDRDDENCQHKNEKREKLMRVLGDGRFCPLQSREIENLLPPKAVLHAVKSRLRKEIKLSENIVWENYRSALLGNFIRDTIMNKEASPKFAADSGTIHDKVRFATDAIAALNSWDDLTDEAKTLTEKIYKFIDGKNNPVDDKKN